jgi:hypothetical protein
VRAAGQIASVHAEAALMPRFQAEHGRAPNQRELAALQERATLHTRVNKDGVMGGRGGPEVGVL